MLGEVLHEAGLPEGLYQVLQGEGEVGRLITDSEDISKMYAGKHLSKTNIFLVF